MSIHALGDFTLNNVTYPNTHLDLFPHDGAVAVDLVNDDGLITGVSVDLPGTPTLVPLFLAKNYSENAGVVDELVRLGVAERTGVARPVSEFETPIEMRLIGEYATAAQEVAA